MNMVLAVDIMRTCFWTLYCFYTSAIICWFVQRNICVCCGHWICIFYMSQLFFKLKFSIYRLRQWGLFSTSLQSKILAQDELYLRYNYFDYFTSDLHIYNTVIECNDTSFILQVLQRILMGTDVVKNVNKNNASHAVLFEALALVSSNENFYYYIF